MTSPRLAFFLACAAVLLAVCPLGAQTNLLPNGNFADPANPLASWRIAFPYEGQYVHNGDYVKATAEHANAGSPKCVVFDLPPGVAGNGGGKIESALVKAEPGATYRVMVDCMAWDFSAKLHAEAYVTDPKPVDKPDKFRVPAMDGHPALVLCYRAQMPDPPAHGKTWTTVQREFTVPEKVTVAGKEFAPEYLLVKAVSYEPTMGAGKSYYSNFRLYKIKGKPAP